MAMVDTAGAGILLKSILFLTDFSEPSEAALPYAVSIARGYGAGLYALHVSTPVSYAYTTPGLAAPAIEAEEENTKAEMLRLESQLIGLRHETTVVRGIVVWTAVEQVIKDHKIDLIVLGTHGRTGAEKFMLGSVAEEIFRRSTVPVLTIGPGAPSNVHQGGRFYRVIFATDFTAASLAAGPYAVSLAQENHARLVLLHVIRQPRKRSDNEERRIELSVAEAIHQLYETVPKNVELRYPLEVAVEHGEPGKRIVDAAKQRGADLIVLGVRDATGRMGAATHLERATAHKVVAYATCPVLTVRH